MKRILCIVISVFIFANSFLVYPSASNQEIDVYEYNKLIRKLTDAYVPDNFVSTEEMTEYPLNRLIVKTSYNDPLENDYGAADKIEGYDCLHILQYETEEETDEAYENFIHDDIEYVEYDYWLTIVDSRRQCYCEGGEKVDFLCSCTGYGFCPCEDPDATGTHYSWNSGAVQVDEAFQLIDEYGINCEPITYGMMKHRDKIIFCKWSKTLPTYDNSGKATWYSRNSEIATVDENGKITGVSPGNTDIVCRYPCCRVKE